MNTIEGNKLIMDFLGWKHHSGDLYWFPNLYPSDENTGETTFNVDEARFHYSWDWLMPVVEKISTIKIKYSNDSDYYSPYPKTFGMQDEDGNFLVRLNVNLLFKAPTLIEATWLAVTDFIQWYNKEQSVKESDTTKAT